MFAFIWCETKIGHYLVYVVINFSYKCQKNNCSSNKMDIHFSLV